jgi:hypothetical protein
MLEGAKFADSEAGGSMSNSSVQSSDPWNSVASDETRLGKRKRYSIGISPRTGGSLCLIDCDKDELYFFGIPTNEKGSVKSVDTVSLYSFFNREIMQSACILIDEMAESNVVRDISITLRISLVPYRIFDIRTDRLEERILVKTASSLMPHAAHIWAENMQKNKAKPALAAYLASKGGIFSRSEEKRSDESFSDFLFRCATQKNP